MLIMHGCHDMTIIEVKTIDVFEIEFFRSELKKYQLNIELDVYDVLVPLN